MNNIIKIKRLVDRYKKDGDWFELSELLWFEKGNVDSKKNLEQNVNLSYREISRLIRLNIFYSMKDFGEKIGNKIYKLSPYKADQLRLKIKKAMKYYYDKRTR